MSCCGAPTGYERVWLFRVVGQPVREFTEQAQALAARTANGGKGDVVRVTRKLST